MMATAKLSRNQHDALEALNQTGMAYYPRIGLMTDGRGASFEANSLGKTIQALRTRGYVCNGQGWPNTLSYVISDTGRAALAKDEKEAQS